MKRFMGCSGMTLTEIMVAISIMVIIATIVAINVVPFLDRAKTNTAELQIKKLEEALELYYQDNGKYPTVEQGLQALVSKPTQGQEPKNYLPGGYLKEKEVPKDPWGKAYIYELAEENGVEKPIIKSFGADGKPGGQGKNADISNVQ